MLVNVIRGNMVEDYVLFFGVVLFSVLFRYRNDCCVVFLFFWVIMGLSL